MGNIFNSDFAEFISLLEKHKVEYILVGGYSVVLHGYPRTTGDMDIWVRPSKENYHKLGNCFFDFGLPLMPQELFLSESVDVFTYGRPPQAIDVMTKCKGLEFDAAFVKSKMVQVDDLQIRLISYSDLIIAKKSAGRHKDLNDLEHLG